MLDTICDETQYTESARDVTRSRPLNVGVVIALVGEWSVCVMDASTKGELRSLIEKLVHSGNPSLDEGLVKKVKAICK